MELKAIETVYSGYRFRSRLEARWAVFFDALGVAYEYEKEGFDLGEAGNYLPDFWLPDRECWLEIKGREPTVEESLKALSLAETGQRDVFLFTHSGFALPTVDATGAFAGMWGTRIAAGERLFRFGIFWAECLWCVAGAVPPGTVSGPFVGIHPSDHWTDHHQRLHGPYVPERPLQYAERLLDAYLAARQARFEHGEGRP
jgi:hypothetical protein